MTRKRACCKVIAFLFCLSLLPLYGAGEYIAMAKLSDMQNEHYSQLTLISREKVKEWTKLTKFRYYLFKRQNWMANLLTKSTESELNRIVTDTQYRHLME